MLFEGSLMCLRFRRFNVCEIQMGRPKCPAHAGYSTFMYIKMVNWFYILHRVHACRLHDFDNNTMLDGLEIYKALTHILPYDELEPDSKKRATAGNAKGKSTEQVLKEKKEQEVLYYTGRRIH